MIGDSIDALIKAWTDTKGIQSDLQSIQLLKLKCDDCETWARACSEKLDGHYFNNVL